MVYQEAADKGFGPSIAAANDAESMKLQRRITSRAVDYAHDGNLEDAIETLEVGLNQYPDNLYFLGQLGQLYRRTGSLEDARQVLERSLELKASDIRTVTSLANVYVELGMDKEAEEMLLTARKLDRNDKFVIVSLAKLMGEHGRYEEAAELLKHSGGLENGNKYVMASYAIVQALRGLHEEARDVLERGHTLYPRDSHLINLLGSLRAEMGDYAQAEDVLTLGMRNDPRNRHVGASLANVFLRQTKYHEAERVLTSVLRHNERDTVLINMLGSAYAHMGLYDRAEDTLQEALRFDPSNMALMTTLGHTYLRAGEYARYNALIESTAAKAAKDDVSYAYLVAKGSLLQGRKAEALEACRRLLEIRGIDAQVAILYMACSNGADTALGSFVREFGVDKFAELNVRAAEIAHDPHLIDMYDPKFCTEDLPGFIITPRVDRSGQRTVFRAASMMILSLVVGASGLHYSGISEHSLAAANFLGAPTSVWMTLMLSLCCCCPDVPQARRISWALRGR